jgi:hypothetical protein
MATTTLKHNPYTKKELDKKEKEIWDLLNTEPISVSERLNKTPLPQSWPLFLKSYKKIYRKNTKLHKLPFIQAASIAWKNKKK